MTSLVISPGALLLLAPALMLALAAVPAAVASRHPLTMGRLVQGAGLAGLAFTLVAAVWSTLAGASAQRTLVVLGSDTGPIPLALSVLADGLTFTILGLVALVVALIARYSTNYLAGEDAHGQFFRWLALTAGA
ncbi:MAG: hypothetical protein MUC77_18420, partial [Chromatiaceae bacterium]|nr:hypothetical protein [Chromatiaceae bacterium]